LVTVSRRREEMVVMADERETVDELYVRALQESMDRRDQGPSR